ncbi:unnamed protein product [Ilex paraguariensis]|uniref:Uncharacterized protein n=1 Tax=Ilex paraguariensis TaxID=185542 RepID=A0ABC8R808_9AQUA
MESLIRHCYVMNPKEFAKESNGDDVYLCEYEYDIHWHTFKRIVEIDNCEGDDEEVDSDEDWSSCKDYDSKIEDMEHEEKCRNLVASQFPTHQWAVEWAFPLLDYVVNSLVAI